jgi:hypothetical protein
VRNYDGGAVPVGCSVCGKIHGVAGVAVVPRSGGGEQRILPLCQWCKEKKKDVPWRIRWREA